MNGWKVTLVTSTGTQAYVIAASTVSEAETIGMMLADSGGIVGAPLSRVRVHPLGDIGCCVLPAGHRRQCSALRPWTVGTA